ncbi:MAG: single-stranded DNA-binding protein [Caldilineaceae bacterium]|nr:single-stranded DNA-binding protein [Caldilineaceae bacterium]
MFQQIILVGHLGSDPEMRYTSSGVPVTNFNLAVSRRWTNQEGQPQEKTTWFRINLWERRAETAAQYLTKGAKVMIIGEIDRARPWNDRDGNLQATIEITANQFRFLDSRAANGSDSAGDSSEQELAAAGEAETVPF